MAAVPSGETLQRRLGVFTCAAIIMGITIGSGIFRVPSFVAAGVPSVGGMALLWVLAGLITLCLALSLAELATLFPRPGGNFVFIREAWGARAAFLYGWMFLVINPAGWAAIALMFAEYLSHFIPLGYLGQRLVAIGVIALVTFANYRSVPLAAALQNIATSAKALALLVLAAAIFALAPGHDGALAQPLSFAIPGAAAFAAGLVGVLWAYEGVATFCALCGEVRDPGKTLPRALTLAVSGVILLYLLVNAAYAYALPIGEIAQSKLVAATATSRVAGDLAASIVAALVMLSTFGAVAAVSLSDPRVLYAMAQEGLFFRTIGRVHPRFGTPHVAVLTAGVLACLWVSVRDFRQLYEAFILGQWPFYALAVLGMMRLRWKRPDLARPYRTPVFPFVPMIFLAAAGYLLVSYLFTDTLKSAIDVALISLGLPIYFLWRRLRVTAPVVEPTA
jgi:amino acid transporter